MKTSTNWCIQRICIYDEIIIKLHIKKDVCRAKFDIVSSMVAYARLNTKLVAMKESLIERMDIIRFILPRDQNTNTMAALVLQFVEECPQNIMIDIGANLMAIANAKQKMNIEWIIVVMKLMNFALNMEKVTYIDLIFTLVLFVLQRMDFARNMEVFQEKENLPSQWLQQ